MFKYPGDESSPFELGSKTFPNLFLIEALSSDNRLLFKSSVGEAAGVSFASGVALEPEEALEAELALELEESSLTEPDDCDFSWDFFVLTDDTRLVFLLSLEVFPSFFWFEQAPEIKPETSRIPKSFSPFLIYTTPFCNRNP